MKSTMLNLVMLGALASCGAANNPDSRNGDDNSGGPTDRSLLAAGSEELQGQLRSQMFRFNGKEQYTYTGEVSKLKKDKLPSSHRTVPNLQYDIHNSVKGPVSLPNSDTSCGNSFDKSIKSRHQDCTEKQDLDLAITWSGKNQGISGEGSWQLISNSKSAEISNKIVWQDFSTGYLWSDLLLGYTFEEAAGIGQGNLENRPCQGIAGKTKHELGRINPDIVSWRLPNRNEFLQADLNGSRFVLPNIIDELVWTASYAGNNEAWAINIKTGVLSLQKTDTKLGVRCIGAVIK